MTTLSVGKASWLGAGLRAVLRRAGTSLLILLVIAYLTMFGLIVGERGRLGLPAMPAQAAAEALQRTVSYVTQHPATYYWYRQNMPWAQLVLSFVGRSAGLLGVALLFAVALGVPLGMAAALFRRMRLAPVVVLVSILGVSVPSFLLAMLCRIGNIQVYRYLSLAGAPLPQAGFGWDAHIIMPAIVLATRPLAQIVQITYVSMTGVLKEDYVRTAQSKGLPPTVVLFRHVLRNALMPILTTVGTSLRFSLASLPVVEAFFVWPGVGSTLLTAIQRSVEPLVTDLIVSLGVLFLLINLALEVLYPLIDPRLRDRAVQAEEVERRTWRDHLSDLGIAFADIACAVSAAVGALRGRRGNAAGSSRPLRSAASAGVALAAQQVPQQAHWRHILRSACGNLPLIAGTLLVLALAGLALFGDRLPAASPYVTHTMLYREGAMGAPPYRPSSVFPWGSDAIGRDVQALVLAGARQTLILAVGAMLARVVVGTVLGVLAGWWRQSWLDRLITGLIAVSSPGTCCRTWWGRSSSWPCSRPAAS